jgi:hypothetical protein
MKRLDQKGSHIVALAVGLLVLGVTAFAGYTVLQNKNEPVASTNSSTNASGTTTAKDLDTSLTELDSSTAQLDSGLDDSALDADLNDLL